jgi:hypothetical protein
MSDSESPLHVLSTSNALNYTDTSIHRPITRNHSNSNRHTKHSKHDTTLNINKSQSFNYSDSDSDFSIGTENKIGTPFIDVKSPASTID